MVKHATSPAHTITDKDGDRLTTVRFQDGLYVTVGHPGPDAGPDNTAGPFTPEQLHAAIAQVSPYTPMPGDLVAASELEKAEEARDKAQALLAGRTSERDGAQRQRDALRKALESEQARSAELLDRAHAAERAKVELQEALGRTRMDLAERTRERDKALGQLERKSAAYDQLVELSRASDLKLRDRLDDARAKAPRPRTPESVTDREVETVMRAMGWWQEGKRIGQYPVNLVRSARRTVADLANLPIQERAEVDAIKAWVLRYIAAKGTDSDSLARELYARGFTAPGGES